MNHPLSSQSSPVFGRYVLIDTIRGLTMLNMLLYHFLWDLVYIAGISVPWYHGKDAYIWQQGICQTFILLSGFCWSFGRHPLKRGLTVFWAGGLITFITMLFTPQNQVVFGVLTLLGSCMLLMIPLDCIMKKITNPVVLILLTVISITLFVLLHPLWDGYPKPAWGNLFTAYLGFPGSDFRSADYFPLLPWFFLFMAGYLFHKFSVRLGWLEAPVLRKDFLRPLTPIGRHSLLIYMLHQPVLYGLTTLIIFLKK